MIHYNGGKYQLSFIWQLQGSVFPKSIIFAGLSALLGIFLEIMMSTLGITSEVEELFGTNFSSSAFIGFSFVLGFTLVFRTSQAYGRYSEGMTLMHLMRSEWFEAASTVMSFSELSERPREEIDRFQHLIVRLFSLMHCGAMQQISDMQEEEFDTLDVRGIDEESRDFLHWCQQERHCTVHVVFQWIQGTILSHIKDGILPVPPPILSRVFQELSNGKVHMDNALKISHTLFPFPYAQMTTVLLLLHALLMPLVVSHYCNNFLLVAIFTFVPVFCFWSLNFIACEIEQPFGDDVNDLPVADMQVELNERLLLLLEERTRRLPTLANCAVMNVHKMRHHRSLRVSFNKADSTRRARSSHKLSQGKSLSIGATRSRSSLSIGEEQEPQNLKDQAEEESQTISNKEPAVLQHERSLSLNMGQNSHRSSESRNIPHQDEKPRARGMSTRSIAISVAKSFAEDATKSSQQNSVVSPSPSNVISGDPVTAEPSQSSKHVPPIPIEFQFREKNTESKSPKSVQCLTNLVTGGHSEDP
eukprot:gnl/MRDRNA2_/MRDRNA2_78761_c0_seq1.p1 gnl/MRDRNA2_/MRDRNA2_78761_c0~~gnl/MRDRNA2_/MRDRNA2_78761_c0_seq1.p1  ORF type:complete len:530 (+),score=50.78 gnl/MRDRNA2_/MRDRNA2_78761_c0_seq1:76-1665(+)